VKPDKLVVPMNVRRVLSAALLVPALACANRSEPPASGLSLQTGEATRIGAPVPDAGIADAIRAAVTVGGGHESLLIGLTSGDRARVASLYERGQFAPLWLNEAGLPTPDARQALAVLTDAATDGLDPADYSAAALGDLAATLEAQPNRPASGRARFDMDLTAAVLRYLHHLHAGRVDPRVNGFRMTAPADADDFANALRSAIAKHRIADAVAEATPPLTLYRSLRTALATYRALAADASLADPPSFPTALEPGDEADGLQILRRRLAAFGDLPATADVSDKAVIYDPPLVEAVKRFQARHGLEPDGLLGRATQAALRVPIAWRVRQIELALERLRWLPHLDPSGFVGVNIPMFHLWAWNSIPPDGVPSFDTNVIVGKALDTQTPVFVEQMDEVIFRPYWNVPMSILRREILPAMARDPDYLRAQNMEIVSGPGDDARTVALSADGVAGLERGALRVRQRPGPRSALGLVKFVFPNDENIYMHATPQPELFSRTRRDFSHGCVRVEDPVALAEWALRGRPEWTRERILRAMNGPVTMRVRLSRPVQVILFYVTAVVMPSDGTVHFAEDIYKHDEKLDRVIGSLRH
jgi:murein L,D-transpeptidase YcbB/YkuD